jgi:hypothetical protein
MVRGGTALAEIVKQPYLLFTPSPGQRMVDLLPLILSRTGMALNLSGGALVSFLTTFPPFGPDFLTSIPPLRT